MGRCIMARKPPNKTLHNKKRLIEALESSLGIVTTACKKAGVSRFTYYDYYKKDEKFRTEVDSIKEVTLDFVESMLLENIKKKEQASIIFYLKTKGKSRGYTEKQEIVINEPKDKVIKIEVLETKWVKPQPKNE